MQPAAVADRPLLSICVPTYNRSELVVRLTRTLLAAPGPFELCIHIDGSTDNSASALAAIADPRLKVTSGPNRGRAEAIRRAIEAASGRFLMLFDDDDELDAESLAIVIGDCAEPPPRGVAGYIYRLRDETGAALGGPFPTPRSNLLALRADHGVAGDRKEVILAEALRAALPDWMGRYRRTPTSLLWARVAMRWDVICRDRPIGTKHYLAAGMTANIRRLKTENSRPMAALHQVRCVAFLRGRYRSPTYFLQSLAGLAYYSVLSVFARKGR